MPEYCTMSRKPGIGKTWFEKYQSDVYPHDYCEINGKKIPPPRYYDDLLKGDPEKPSQAYLDLKEKRLKDMEAPLDALDDPRWVDLKRIEDVRNYKYSKKVRQIELDNSIP